MRIIEMSDEVSLIVNGNRKTLIKHSGKTTSKIVVVDAKGDGLTRDDEVTIIGDTSKFTKEEIEQNLFANYQNTNTAKTKETAAAYRKTGDAFKFTTSHKFSLGSMYDAVEQKSAPSASSTVGNTGNAGQNDANMLSTVKKFDPAELNKASMAIMGGMFPMGFGGMDGNYPGFCDFSSIVGAYQNLLKYCQGLFGASTSNPSVSNPDGSTPATADKQPANTETSLSSNTKADDSDDPSLRDDSDVKTKKHTHKKHGVKGKVDKKAANANKGDYKPTHFFNFEEFKKANPDCKITPFADGRHNVTTQSGSKYEFDAKGNMVKKVSDGTTTTFAYDSNGTLKTKKVAKYGSTTTTSYKKTDVASQWTYKKLTQYLEKKGQTYTSSKNTIKYTYGNTTKTYKFDDNGKMLSNSTSDNKGNSTNLVYKSGYEITTTVAKAKIEHNGLEAICMS
jgi:YD repeat-containing protein